MRQPLVLFSSLLLLREVVHNTTYAPKAIKNIGTCLVAVAAAAGDACWFLPATCGFCGLQQLREAHVHGICDGPLRCICSCWKKKDSIGSCVVVLLLLSWLVCCRFVGVVLLSTLLLISCCQRCCSCETTDEGLKTIQDYMVSISFDQVLKCSHTLTPIICTNPVKKTSGE